jgi:hypothetical protein
MKVRIILHYVLFLFAFLVPFQVCIADPSATTGTNTNQVAPSINIGPFIGQEAAKEKHGETSYQWLAPTLDFVKCLLWPGLVAGVVLYFRKEIRERLSKLQSAKTPAGELTFGEALASKQMDGQKAEANPLQGKGVNDVIKAFVTDVTKEFLRASSWNGLKVLYLCTECHNKHLAFDLKQACASDGSMSYDYAFGYIVASCSAQFLRYESPDNVRIMITQVFEAVQNEIMPAIEARLKFVGLPVANDFNSQLEKIKKYVASLEAGGGKS